MFFKQNIRRNTRRVIFAAMIIAAALAQNAKSGEFSVFGLKIIYMLPLVVSIGFFEKETCGLVFGIAGGCLLDLSSPAPDGLNALFFAFAGCAAGVLAHYLLRRNIISAFIITAVSSFLYGALSWLVNVMIPVGDTGCRLLLTRFLPSSGLTVLFLPVVYIISGLLMKYLKDNDSVVVR